MAVTSLILSLTSGAATVGSDGRKHAFADAFGLLLSNPRHLEQRAMRAGLEAGEVLQGAVVEDDVGRHVPLPGQLEPERAQRLEERALILAERRRGGRRRPSPARLRTGGAQGARLAIQHGVSPAAEERHAVACELQGRILLACTREQARLPELIDVAPNLRHGALPEQAERAQLL